MTPVLIGLAAIAGGAVCSAIGASIGHACARAETEFWRTRAHQHFRRLRAMRADEREIDLFDENGRARPPGASQETPPG